jgi:hypothetical protein
MNEYSTARRSLSQIGWVRHGSLVVMRPQSIRNHYDILSMVLGTPCLDLQSGRFQL